jgi:hypothetical protein
VKLELIDCGFTRIEDLNPLKSLQDFKIIQKGDLTILCALDDIARIEISSNCDVQLTFPKNCLAIELCACRLNLQYNNDCSMNKTLLYEQLSLKVEHWPLNLNPKIFDDWLLYPDVEFRNKDTDHGRYPLLPVHYGKILRLEGKFFVWRVSHFHSGIPHPCQKQKYYF